MNLSILEEDEVMFMKNEVKSEQKLNCRDKHFYMCLLAEKDKEIEDLKMHHYREIEDLKWEHKKEIEEKNKTVELYRKNAEQAYASKRRVVKEDVRKIRLNFSWAVLIISGMAVIPWFIWFVDTCLKSFWLWAN